MGIVDAIFVNDKEYHGGHHRKWTLTGMDADSISSPVTPFNQHFDEFGSATYESSVGYALDTAVEQQQLLLDLLDVPAVAARFPDGLPDMSDRKQRIEVWSAVIEHYKPEGLDKAEVMAMFFIERYLKKFTRHSQFNISDFGPSFVDREYPESLFGRIMQDCGVYAVSVATEFYAALESSGVEGYEFMIFFVPAHVMMVMLSPSQDRFWSVNNDEIEGPTTVTGLVETQEGAAEGSKAKGESVTEQERAGRHARDNSMYGKVAQLNAKMNNFVWWGSPMTGVSLGTTGEASSAEFDKTVWEKYEDAAQ